MNTITYMPDLAEVIEGTGFVECDREGAPLEDNELVITREGFEHKVTTVTFTKINNLILGNEGEPGLIAYLNGAELKLLLLISRFTVGYQDRRYWQASHETVAKMAGIGRKAVMMAADSLSSDDKKLISFSRVRGVTMWQVHPENIPAFLLKMSQNDSSQPEAERVKMTQPMSQNDSTDESKGLNQRVILTHPSKKESIKKKERKKKKILAPKNGAPQVAEISADLAEPQTAPPQVTPVEVTPIQGAVQTAPPIPKSPPKRANDEMFKFMAIACGYFTPASETADGKDNYHGKESRIGKELKELKTLNMTLAELEQMTAWLRGQWKYQDGRHINLADYRAELNNFRDHLKAVADNQVDGKAEVIKAIQATCVAPMDGWGGKAKRLGELAERIITRGEQGKVSGFKGWWLGWADSAPSLEQFTNNWLKYSSAEELPNVKTANQSRNEAIVASQSYATAIGLHTEGSRNVSTRIANITY